MCIGLTRSTAAFLISTIYMSLSSQEALTMLQALKLTLNDRIKDKICNGGHNLTLGERMDLQPLDTHDC